MNDPFTEALSNIGGLLDGTNPPFAPQITQLIGFNIPGKPLVSTQEYFLTQMDSWLTTIPMTTQWIIVIQRFPSALNSNILQSLERTDGSKHGFDISSAVAALGSYPFQSVIGCLFAHEVTIPSEQLDVGSVTVANNRGFLPGVVANGRSTEPPTLAITFRETNTSFVDSVIRPWSILTAHYGLASRPGDSATNLIAVKDPKNIKTNISILQYTRSLQNTSMIPRKVWQFFNCAPFNVGEQTLEYTEEHLATIPTRWTYSNYTVADNLYLPIGAIISNYVKSGFPNITSGVGTFGPPYSPIGG